MAMPNGIANMSSKPFWSGLGPAADRTRRAHLARFTSRRNHLLPRGLRVGVADSVRDVSPFSHSATPNCTPRSNGADRLVQQSFIAIFG
jgi:hypothetical protein